MAGKLIVHAPDVYMGLFGKFNIFFNDKKITAIRAGERISLTVYNDGKLQVQIGANQMSDEYFVPASKLTELEFTVSKPSYKCTPRLVKQEDIPVPPAPEQATPEEQETVPEEPKEPIKKGGYKLTAREMQLMAIDAGCMESTATNGGAGFNHIADSLRPDEKVVFCIATGPIYARQHSLGNSAIVLTDARIIFAGGTSDFIKTVSSFSLDLLRIDAVDMQAAMMAYNLMITSAGEQIKCTFAAMKDQRGAEYLRNFINAIYDCKQAKNEVKQETNVINQVSAADELRKFKELLDMGIITQEEFDAKKKQLLGL